jgi:hypothetical protein
MREIEVEIGENVLKSTKIEVKYVQREDFLDVKLDQIIGKPLILYNKTRFLIYLVNLI